MLDRPRESVGRGKAQDIIAAARGVFLAEGLAQAKMADIARRAQVSTATLYGCFASKEELFRAVVEDVAAQAADRMLIDADDTAGDPIERLANAFMERLTDPDIRGFFRIMAADGRRFPKLLAFFDRHTHQRGYDAAVSLFDRLAREGRFADGQADTAARQLIGMLEHETLILGILYGDDAYLGRDQGEIAREAVRTLRARFTPDTRA